MVARFGGCKIEMMPEKLEKQGRLEGGRMDGRKCGSIGGQMDLRNEDA